MDKVIEKIDDIIESFCEFNIGDYQWSQCCKKIPELIKLMDTSGNKELKEKLSKLQYDHIPYRYIIQLIKVYLPYSHLNERPLIHLTKEQIRVLVGIVNRQYVNGYCLFDRWPIVLNTLFIWRCHGYDAKLFTRLVDVFDNFFSLMIDPNKLNDLSSIFGCYQKEMDRGVFDKYNQDRDSIKNKLWFGLINSRYIGSIGMIEEACLEEYRGQPISTYLPLWQEVGEEIDEWFIPADRIVESKDIIDQIDDRIEELCEFNPYDPDGKKLIAKIKKFLDFIQKITTEENQFKTEPVQYDDELYRKQLLAFLEQYLPCSRLSLRKPISLTKEQKIGYLGFLYPVFMNNYGCGLSRQMILSSVLFIWKQDGYQLERFKRLKEVLLHGSGNSIRYCKSYDIFEIFDYKFQGYLGADRLIEAENYSNISWFEKGVLNMAGWNIERVSSMIRIYLEETSGQPYTDHLEFWSSLGEKFIQIGIDEIHTRK